MIRKSDARILTAVCALSLTACGPAPTGTTPAPGQPSGQPSTTPAPPAPSPAGSVSVAAAYVVRLQADQALKAFATLQQGPFSLCLGRISRASLSLKLPASALGPEFRSALEAAGVSISSTSDGTTLSLNRELKLADLLSGIELRFPGVGGNFEGRLLFQDADGAELGFVTWQNESGSRELSIQLSPAGPAPAGESCPQIEARISGGRLLGAGGRVTSPDPLPNPQTSPSPEPTASPATGDAPGVPQNAKVVEQGQTYLTLQWDFPADARSFKLYLDGTQVASGHVTPNYHRFEGLRASTTYRLGVQAVNAAGTSEIVSVPTATTSGGRSASGNFSSGGSGNTSSGSSGETARELEEGPSFVVESNGSAIQSIVRNAMADNGDFVVVWSASNAADPDFGIFAQRYDADGDPVDEPVLVNQNTSGQQFSPDVAMDAEGNFVVSWISSAQNVVARRFDADGDALGDEVMVRTVTSSNSITSQAIALDDQGDFVVTWNEFNFDTIITNQVMARRYARRSGFGSTFPVNEALAEIQMEPSVAMSPDGKFVIAWQNTAANTEIHAQRYSASGAASGGIIVVNEGQEATGTYTVPDVAMAADGSFVVAWQSNASDEPSIVAQRFDAGGSLDDDPIAVTTQSNSINPSVAMDDNGNFTVVWGDVNNPKYGDVYGQRYASDGDPLGDSFQVKSDRDLGASAPDVALDPDGDTIITWVDKYEAGSFNPGPPPVSIPPNYDYVAKLYRAK